MELPPYPKRPAKPLSLPRFCITAYDNLLATWPEAAFVFRQFQLKFPLRRITIANSPKAVKHVLVDNANNYHKGPEVRRALSPLLGNGLFINEDESWLHQRRSLAPLFKPSALISFTETVIASTQAMLQRWANKYHSDELELTREMTQVTAEVICGALLDYRLSEQQAEDAFSAFTGYQDSLGRFDPVGLLNLPNWLPHPHARRGKQAVEQLNLLFNDMVQRQYASKETASATTSTLFDACRDGKQQMRDEIATLFLAGHETTANTLSWAFFLLSQYPDVETELCAEILRVLADRQPTLDDLPKLNYARAVIEETMRLYPPLHILSRQALQDDQLGQHIVPAGSVVIVAPWLLHRHKVYWNAPDAFRPQRFLEEFDTHPSKYRYIPFSAGPRRCPASHFAMTEAILILVMVMQRYHLGLRPNHPVEPLGRLTLRSRYGLPMQLYRRN